MSWLFLYYACNRFSIIALALASSSLGSNRANQYWNSQPVNTTLLCYCIFTYSACTCPFLSDKKTVVYNAVPLVNFYLQLYWKVENTIIYASNILTKLEKNGLLRCVYIYIVDPAGSVYVRWGRKECPTNGTEIVYTGRIKFNTIIMW